MPLGAVSLGGNVIAGAVTSLAIGYNYNTIISNYNVKQRYKKAIGL